VHLSNFEFVDGNFCQYFEPATSSNTYLAGQPCSSVASQAVEYEDRLLEEVGLVLPTAEVAHLHQGMSEDKEHVVGEDAQNFAMSSGNTSSRGSNWTPKKCLWIGCQSVAIFKRKFEYDRHMRKHTRAVSIPCPVQYCPRQGSRAFYRWDKLSDHLKTGHMESEKCRCLVEGCRVTNIPLCLLRYHARWHRIPSAATFNHDFVHTLKATTFRSKCDLRRCKRWFVETNELHEHLSTHSLDERLTQSDVIREMGFDPNTIAIVCPVCQQHCADCSEFRTHLEAAHLVTEEHWFSFKAQISVEWITDMWRFPFMWCHYHKTDILCNYCGMSGPLSQLAWQEHCDDLLKKQDLDEVIASRTAILRLYPEFSNHPTVFEMDKPTAHASMKDSRCAGSSVES